MLQTTNQTNKHIRQTKQIIKQTKSVIDINITMKLLIEPETGVAIASMVTGPRSISKNNINNCSYKNKSNTESTTSIQQNKNKRLKTSHQNNETTNTNVNNKQLEPSLTPIPANLLLQIDFDQSAKPKWKIAHLGIEYDLPDDRPNIEEVMLHINEMAKIYSSILLPNRMENNKDNNNHLEKFKTYLKQCMKTYGKGEGVK